jgi:hypothetical protein
LDAVQNQNPPNTEATSENQNSAYTTPNRSGERKESEEKNRDSKSDQP